MRARTLAKVRYSHVKGAIYSYYERSGRRGLLMTFGSLFAHRKGWM